MNAGAMCAAALLLTFLLPGRADAAGCVASGEMPELSVRAEFDTPKMVVTRTYQDIERIARERGAPGMGGIPGRIRGLTATSLEVRADIRVRVRPQSDGNYCVTAAKAAAVFAYRDTTIYLARPVTEIACTRTVVIGHEMTHVGINEKVLRQHLPRFEQVLRTAARDLPALSASSGKAGAQEIRARLMAALRPAIDAFEQERGRANAAIDTPANYRSVQAKCSEWK